jgi:ABC-2 type transport system ATP-binding protein
LEYSVETFGLTKVYGSTVALDNLTTRIESNKIRVILGPNGSGKTTFLHLISTVLRPTKGTASVFGHDIVKEPLKVRELVGISFQEPRGFWRHKPKHILSFHASVYGVEGKDRQTLVEKIMKEFGLWESRDKKFMDLSGGQAKRLEVAKIFIQRPVLAIFDEPTAMVDLDGKRMIWDKIRELKESGSTVIVATNEVREAEYLADKISIFAKGKEIVTSSLSELKDMVRGGDTVEIEFSNPVDNNLAYSISSIQGTYSLRKEDERKIVAKVTRSEDWIPVFFNSFRDKENKILSVRVREPSLDDVFMHFIGETGEKYNTEASYV